MFIPWGNITTFYFFTFDFEVTCYKLLCECKPITSVVIILPNQKLRISTSGFWVSADASFLLQINVYVKYISFNCLLYIDLAMKKELKLIINARIFFQLYISCIRADNLYKGQTTPCSCDDGPFACELRFPEMWEPLSCIRNTCDFWFSPKNA